MQWTKVLGTAILGAAFLLGSQVPQVEALQCSNNLLRNSGFEETNYDWILFPAPPPVWNSHALIGSWGTGYWGSKNAWLQGHGQDSSDAIEQFVTIPRRGLGIPGVSMPIPATLSFALKITTAEARDGRVWDTLNIDVYNTRDGRWYEGLATYTNVDAPTHSSYRYHTVDLSRFEGSTVIISFEGKEDYSNATFFYLDNITLATESRCFSPFPGP